MLGGQGSATEGSALTDILAEFTLSAAKAQDERDFGLLSSSAACFRRFQPLPHRLPTRPQTLQTFARCFKPICRTPNRSLPANGVSTVAGSWRAAVGLRALAYFAVQESTRRGSDNPARRRGIQEAVIRAEKSLIEAMGMGWQGS